MRTVVGIAGSDVVVVVVVGVAVEVAFALPVVLDVVVAFVLVDVLAVVVLEAVVVAAVVPDPVDVGSTVLILLPVVAWVLLSTRLVVFRGVLLLPLLPPVVLPVGPLVVPLAVLVPVLNVEVLVATAVVESDDVVEDVDAVAALVVDGGTTAVPQSPKDTGTEPE